MPARTGWVSLDKSCPVLCVTMSVSCVLYHGFLRFSLKRLCLFLCSLCLISCCHSVLLWGVELLTLLCTHCLNGFSCLLEHELSELICDDFLKGIILCYACVLCVFWKSVSLWMVCSCYIPSIGCIAFVLCSLFFFSKKWSSFSCWCKLLVVWQNVCKNKHLCFRI